MNINCRTLFAVFAFVAPVTLAPAIAEQTLTPSEAFNKTKSGEIVLVDVRTPEEWNETGSGMGAQRLDMRQPDFLAQLDKLLGPDKTKPVAFICAAGGRSQSVVGALQERGYTGAVDVPEGMLGSSAGPGWIANGLPLQK